MLIEVEMPSLWEAMRDTTDKSRHPAGLYMGGLKLTLTLVNSVREEPAFGCWFTANPVPSRATFMPKDLPHLNTSRMVWPLKSGTRP